MIFAAQGYAAGPRKSPFSGEAVSIADVKSDSPITTSLSTNPVSKMLKEFLISFVKYILSIGGLWM